MSEFTECLWCHSGIRRTPLVYVDLTLINCPRCGCYTVDFTLLGDDKIDMLEMQDTQRHMIASYVHQLTSKGEVPKVTPRVVQQIVSGPSTSA